MSTSTSRRQPCSAPSPFSSCPRGPVDEPLQRGPGHPEASTSPSRSTPSSSNSPGARQIDPAKLNETLGAIATAFNGRGEKFGQTLTDFDALLAKIEPSLPNLSHDIEAAVPAFDAYADAAPDLIQTFDNATTAEQQHRRRAAESGRVPGQRHRLWPTSATTCVGTNRQALTDCCTCWCRPPICSTSTTRRWVRYRRAPAVREVPPPQYPGISSSAGLTLGIERYRYPADLPKVAAKRRPATATELGLPELPPEFRPPFYRRRRRRQPVAVRQPGHPAELRWTQAAGCSGRSTGRPQHRTDRTSGMTRSTRHAHQVRDLRARDGGADRLPVLHLRSVPEPVRRTAIRLSSPMRRG